MADYLTKLYKKDRIKRFDVLSWANKILPSNPKISIHKAGEGSQIVKIEKKKLAKKGRLINIGTKLARICLGAFGALLIGLGLIFWFKPWVENPLINYSPPMFLRSIGFLNYTKTFLPSYLNYFGIGGSLIFFGFFIGWFNRIGKIQGNKGIGGAEATNAPKILVNNETKAAPFVDATGHTSAQLFGSIAWDPYQTGGLGTPEHQRCTAGDVHRSSLGILYIDEIKNLGPLDAVTLLSVLEDGALPVTMRSQFHGSGTSAMAVSTEPIPALFFLLAAGNFDSINKIHPALMDRLIGYGKVVRMNNDMNNNIANRRKYVQFIAQESKRFSLLPFSREACIEIVKEGRRRSNKRDCLATKFRPLIAVIKTAGTLAHNEKVELVESRHVIEAINEHCKTIQKQLLEHYVEERGKLLEIDPKGHQMGTIYGLAVSSDSYSGEMTGTVSKIKAQLIKKDKLKDNKLSGYFKVTGIAKESKWIKASIDKVRSVILHKYNVDIEQEYFTHIDFSQSYGVDGPSAGVTMTILLCSLLEGKPIRQDVAVTGEINISSSDKIEVTAVGGIHEKIKAAETWNFKKVIIPYKNLKHSIDESDYKIEVIGAKSLDDYLKEVLINE